MIFLANGSDFGSFAPILVACEVKLAHGFPVITLIKKLLRARFWRREGHVSKDFSHFGETSDDLQAAVANCCTYVAPCLRLGNLDTFDEAAFFLVFFLWT